MFTGRVKNDKGCFISNRWPPLDLPINLEGVNALRLQAKNDAVNFRGNPQVLSFVDDRLEFQEDK